MTVNAHIHDANETDIGRIAEIVALMLQPGDVIALCGDLGAGKTTFARSLIRAFVANPNLEVASPTFSLLQSYPNGRFPIAHVDLYRLNDPEDAHQLGLDDALQAGALVIEWPDRLGDDLLSDNRLQLNLSDGSSAELRDLNGVSAGTWDARWPRTVALYEFLNRQTDWRGAQLSFLQGDASTRSYARLSGGSSPALVMNAPPDQRDPASKQNEYADRAKLARNMRPFVAVSDGLRTAGIAAPIIHATDLEKGFLIIEDLGDAAFGPALARGAGQHELWRAACDVLIALHDDVPDHTWTFSDDCHYRLPVFSDQLMHIEASLLLDYYWPHVHNGDRPKPAVIKDFQAVADPLFRRAAQSNRHWVLRDFHSPNLIWRPDEAGLARVGVIDFQDALRGPAEYDLVSLLQDARVDVPEALEHTLLDHYCATITKTTETAESDIRMRYAILGAQRALKILGIFARLAHRDHKPAYLAHVPRVWGYLERNLKHPSLADLKAWLDRHFPPETRMVTMVKTRG